MFGYDMFISNLLDAFARDEIETVSLSLHHLFVWRHEAAGAGRQVEDIPGGS